MKTKTVLFSLAIMFASNTYSQVTCQIGIIVGHISSDSVIGSSCIGYIKNDTAIAFVNVSSITNSSGATSIKRTFADKTEHSVIVSTDGGNICISGTIGGETVIVYNAAGSLVKNVKSTSDNTVISGLNGNSVYVVKIGGTSVKVAL